MNSSKTVLLALLLLGFSRISGAEYEERFSSGKDWATHMSQREKFISLLPPALLFNEYDIHLRRSLPEYIVLLDHILLRNPQLEGEDVSNIFASAIYLFEPQHREALKTLEIDFLRGDLQAEPLRPPRLNIDEIVRELTTGVDVPTET